MKTTIKDHSSFGNSNLPEVPPLDINLFHWSPSRNRNRIRHDGLKTGVKSLQGDWRPPYVCFSDDPILAWYLSGEMWPDIKEWDLWMCHVPSQTSFDHWEIILDTYYQTGRHYVKEYRIYTRVFKRDLHYVGSRSQ